MDEADAREVALGDTDELGEAGLDAVRDAGVHKEDGSLKGGGGLSEDVVGGALGEEDQSGSLLSENGFDEVIRKLNEHRDHLRLGPGLEVSISDGVGDGGVLEVAVEGNAGSVDTERSSAGSVSLEKGHLVAEVRVAGSAERGEDFTFEGSEVHQSELEVFLLGLKVIARDGR